MRQFALSGAGRSRREICSWSQPLHQTPLRGQRSEPGIDVLQFLVADVGRRESRHDPLTAAYPEQDLIERQTGPGQLGTDNALCGQPVTTGARFLHPQTLPESWVRLGRRWRRCRGRRLWRLRRRFSRRLRGCFTGRLRRCLGGRLGRLDNHRRACRFRRRTTGGDEQTCDQQQYRSPYASLNTLAHGAPPSQIDSLPLSRTPVYSKPRFLASFLPGARLP
jgi:hypothetical protein